MNRKPSSHTLMLSGLIFSGLLVAVCLPQASQETSQSFWVVIVGFLANMVMVLGDRKSKEIDTASGFIVVVLAAVTYGPAAALLTSLASALPYLLTAKSNFTRCLATRSFSGAVTAMVFYAADVSIHTPTRYILAVFLAAALYQSLQMLTTTTLLTLSESASAREHLQTIGPKFGFALLLYGPVVAAFACLLPSMPASALLLSFMAAAAHQLMDRAYRSKSFEQLLTELTAEIPGALLSALDAADSYTAQHSASVASYSYDLALLYGLEDKQAKRVHAAALLHDVGKIGVPDHVLTKPGRLDDREWELLQKHPEVGANIVRRLPGFHLLERGILHHHERLNGTGYPKGLLSEQIPLEAQIIAVADTYSAITTSRSYRAAQTPEHAISELRRDVQAGKLSPALVELFIAILDQKNDEYRTGRHTGLREEVLRARGWAEPD